MSKKHNKVNNSMSGQVVNGLENALGLKNAQQSLVPFYANSSRHLLSYRYIDIAYFYKSNSFIKTAVDLPVDDAFRENGFTIDSNTLTADDISRLEEYMSDHDDIKTIKDCCRWGRLFGGGAVIASTDQQSDTPLNIETLKNKKVEFKAVDRWQIPPVGSILENAEQFMLQSMENKNNYMIFDKSRVKLYTGKTQPYFIRRMFNGWGVSILESIIPELNQYLTGNSAVLELLSEAKIDILKISGLSELLASAGGEEAIRKRIDIANNNKDFKSMLAMDINDDYQQKQISFGGLDRIVEKIFLLICSATRIPYSKLFGKGATGLGTGADLDIENYNAMVSSEIRVPITPIIKWIIDIRCIQLFGRKIPDLIIKWKPLRVLGEKEQQEVTSSKINSYIQLLNAGVMTRKQVAEKLTNEQIILFNEEEMKALENEENFNEENFNEENKQVKNSFWNKILKK